MVSGGVTPYLIAFALLAGILALGGVVVAWFAGAERSRSAEPTTVGASESRDYVSRLAERLTRTEAELARVVALTEARHNAMKGMFGRLGGRPPNDDLEEEPISVPLPERLRAWDRLAAMDAASSPPAEPSEPIPARPGRRVFRIKRGA